MPRVKAWMNGYYKAQIEHRVALSDLPLEDLDRRYLRELAIRAEKETRDLVR